MCYVPFDPGIEMRTHFLTEQMAYFLGGIFSSEEKVLTPFGEYRIAPVRYNYNTATNIEIGEHYEYVRSITTSVDGIIQTVESIRGTVWDNRRNRLPGFSTFFKSSASLNLTDLIPTFRIALIQSPKTVQRAFLVGVFDGRCSPDIDRNSSTVRMLALDCITDEVGSFLAEMLELMQINYNYNIHRERVEGGRPRNPQLRIRDVDKFMDKIGLISPRRINLLKEAYEHTYNNVEIVEESGILAGLKTIHLGQ